jgi:hypothetical protein
MDKVYEKLIEILSKSPIYIIGGLSIFAILVGFGVIAVNPEGKVSFNISENVQVILIGLGIFGFSIFLFVVIKTYLKKKVDTRVPAMTKDRVEAYNILNENIGVNLFHFICIVKEENSFSIDVECPIAAEIIENNARLKGLLRNRTWADKVEQYKKYAVKMVRLSQEYDKSLDKELEQGDIIRLVFDVEEGGVFYGKIHKGNEIESGKVKEKIYLFAATLDQSAIDECTKRTGLLVDKFRELKKLAPITLSK